MGKSKIDWALIKHEYTAGVEVDGRVTFPSLEELARKHRCSHNSLRVKSAEENWPEERKQFQDNVYRGTLEQTKEARILTAKELDELCNRVSTALLQQLLELVISEEELEPVGRTAIKFSRNALELQKMARIALGLPTEATQSSSSVSVVASDLKALETQIKALDNSQIKGLLNEDDEG